MKTMYIHIPTYDPKIEGEYDNDRLTTVMIQITGGVRVIMGDPNDDFAPDVLIERAIGLWRVIVHPDRGDPLCIIEIGKSRAKIENSCGDTLLVENLR